MLPRVGVDRAAQEGRECQLQLFSLFVVVVGFNILGYKCP